MNPIIELLVAGRTDAPEPSLLPWLARHVAAGDAPALAAVAVSMCLLRPPTAWPVVADAVIEVLAVRDLPAWTVQEVVEVLPPMAGHLDRARAARLSWSRIGPDAWGYAELTGVAPGANIAAGPVRRPWWDEIGATRTRSGGPLPPLASLRSLAQLAAGSRVTDDQAVYLLPHRWPAPHSAGPVLRAVRRAVEAESFWYVAAQVTRAHPFLTAAERRMILDLLDDLPGTWADHLRTVLCGRPTAWPSDEWELAASHPAVAALEDLAATHDPAELAVTCADAVQRMAVLHCLDDEWDVDDHTPLPAHVDGVAQRPRPAPGGRRTLGLEVSVWDVSVPECFVNAFVAVAGADHPATSGPLALGLDHDVVCSLGRADPRSLLGGESARFPVELLPVRPIELTAVLILDGAVVAHGPLTLGAEDDDTDSDPVRLRLPRQHTPGIVECQLALYFEHAAVHIQALTLPYAQLSDRGPSSRLQFRISRSLSDLHKVRDRSASFVMAGTSVVVNGLEFAPVSFAAEPGRIDTAVKDARYQLYRTHFRTVGEDEHTLYSTRGLLHAKPMHELVSDLGRLAGYGAQVYDALFRGNTALRVMRAMLRQEADARGRAPVLQVVELPDRPMSIPWSIVYDLPIGSDPATYRPCPSIADFGPAGAGGPAPARCPYEDEHRDGGQWRPDELCPWGFWGLSTIIEHPPHVDRDLESVIWNQPDPPELLMVGDPALDRAVSAAHIAELRGRLGTLRHPAVAGKAGLRAELRSESMDVVYVYSHLAYRDSSPWSAALSAIRLGTDSVAPQDITSWSTSSAWPTPHWPARHPLVVINGCHSVEFTTGSLGNFVDAFANRASASGVIGTEISIDQRVAGWAMELFLAELRTEPVGAALRATRWQMFHRGNLMGLAYTPYCLAVLRLRETEEIS